MFVAHSFDVPDAFMCFPCPSRYSTILGITCSSRPAQRRWLHGLGFVTTGFRKFAFVLDFIALFLPELGVVTYPITLSTSGSAVANSAARSS